MRTYLGSALAVFSIACASSPKTPPVVGQATTSAAPLAGGNRILVEIDDLRNSKGNINCDLFASAEGYPKESEKAVIPLNVRIKDNHATCVFENVRPGTYAVAYLHDENDNNTMDTNWIGIPSEGHGASNDARGFLSAPSFDDAKFEFVGGTATLRLKTSY